MRQSCTTGGTTLLRSVSFIIVYVSTSLAAGRVADAVDPAAECRSAYQADQTRSLRVNVPGDYEFTVGETVEFGEEEFTVEGLQIREDAPEYRHEKLDHPGDLAYAKDLKRVYARDETLTAWSAW